ncbi:MAG: methionyl-tRNA formyltransferase [Defluviitaleaceae bacterium]|nr:methionyl-tRNA formyltransferase [Defluviitaleaceae bacterium]
MKRMRIVFMGTPAFACASLRVLLKAHEVVAVFTQPDRPAGRGKKLQFSPVKEMAQEAGIPVFQPQRLFLKKDDPQRDEIKKIRSQLASLSADIFVVAAYGLLLPKAVLEMPRIACINVHASLLPRYRGASPIHAALLNGDATTGITIMHMAEGLDTGDMILKKELAIAPNEHFPALHDRMATLGGAALLEALELLATGAATRTPQDNLLACYAPIIKKTDGLIDWTLSTNVILNKIRALDPWPTAYTLYDESPLKIWRGEVVTISATEETTTAGTVLSADNHGLCVRTGDGALLATELQAANGKRMPAGDYLRGREVAVGASL